MKKAVAGGAPGQEGPPGGRPASKRAPPSPSTAPRPGTRLSLLDRGFIFAIAHVRGGGELGQYWYQAGKLMRKKNTFTDFIACAERLILVGCRGGGDGVVGW